MVTKEFQELDDSRSESIEIKLPITGQQVTWQTCSYCFSQGPIQDSLLKIYSYSIQENRFPSLILEHSHRGPKSSTCTTTFLDCAISKNQTCCTCVIKAKMHFSCCAEVLSLHFTYFKTATTDHQITWLRTLPHENHTLQDSALCC